MRVRDQSPEAKAAKAAYDREYRTKNKERIAEAKRAGVLANAEREAARVKAWVEANRERSREIKKAWAERNPEKVGEYNESVRGRKAEYMKTYRQEKPEVWKREAAKRRRSCGRATPPWVDRRALDAIYVQARAAGKHVDHIIPLRGKLVSGLNVPWNLQLLDPTANRRKGNRHAD